MRFFDRQLYVGIWIMCIQIRLVYLGHMYSTNIMGGRPAPVIHSPIDVFLFAQIQLYNLMDYFTLYIVTCKYSCIVTLHPDMLMVSLFKYSYMPQ